VSPSVCKFSLLDVFIFAGLMSVCQVYEHTVRKPASGIPDPHTSLCFCFPEHLAAVSSTSTRMHVNSTADPWLLLVSFPLF
jgi:hypothetical protein